MGVCLDFVLESQLSPRELVSLCEAELGVSLVRPDDNLPSQTHEEWHFEFKQRPFILRIAASGVAIQTTMDWYFLWDTEARAEFIGFGQVFMKVCQANKFFLIPDAFLIVPNYIMSHDPKELTVEEALHAHYGPPLQLTPETLEELEAREAEIDAYFEMESSTSA